MPFSRHMLVLLGVAGKATAGRDHNLRQHRQHEKATDSCKYPPGGVHDALASTAGASKNQRSFHFTRRRRASSLMRSISSRDGSREPASHRETVVWVTPEMAASSRCETFRTVFRMWIIALMNAIYANAHPRASTKDANAHYYFQRFRAMHPA